MINLYALSIGLAVGAIIGILKLPAPFPTSLNYVLGIIGIYAGYIITNHFKG